MHRPTDQPTTRLIELLRAAKNNTLRYKTMETMRSIAKNYYLYHYKNIESYGKNMENHQNLQNSKKHQEHLLKFSNAATGGCAKF